MNINDRNPMTDATYSESEPLHFVFDLDDTLTWTACDYDRAKQAFAEYVQHTVAPMWEEEEISRVVEQIDTERIAEQNYSKERFAGSMKQAYHEIAGHMTDFYEEIEEPDAYADAYVPDDLRQSFDWLVDETETVLSAQNVEKRAERAFHFGWDVVDQFPSHYAQDGFIGQEDEEHMMDMSEVLHYFGQQEDVELHLLTAGDEIVQEPKIRGLQLDQYFPEEQRHIVTRDKEDVLAEMAANYGENHVAMWGNSMNSDIDPAQTVGIGQIFFHTHDWEHGRFENGVDTEHEKFMDIHYVKEGVDLYHELTGKVLDEQ